MDGDKSEHLLEAIPVMASYCDIIGVRSFAHFENREDDYTEKILNRPAEVSISNTSGLAGIAYWINKHYHTNVTKQDDVVVKMKEAIDNLYADGRTTVMGEEELEALYNTFSKAGRSRINQNL